MGEASMKTKARKEKRRFSPVPPGLLCLVLLALMISACSSSRSYKINLMPAPAVFEDGAVNPLPKGQPPVSYDDFRMLYATDRKPSDDPYKRPFYLDEAGFILRLGEARVKAGPEGADWETVRRTTLAKNRTENYPLEVVSVDDTGYLSSTYTFMTRSIQESASPDQRGQEFADLVDERLAVSGVKDVYVYLHGFRVMFDVPVLVASELWHFMGYRGAFISYSWASTPSLFAYFADLEAAVIMARKLRLFLTYLAEETQAQKIHIIGFSAGSRLVVRALHQLALLKEEDTDEEIRKEVRIGNVIIVGGDISHQEFGVALADGMLRIAERTTIYVSSDDRALAFVSRLFRRKRLGELWDEELPQRVANFLEDNPSLQFIDVTEAADSTYGNGHSFFRKSPWVSSDLIALLSYDLDAGRRGLEKEPDLLVWTYPPDFIERLRKVLAEMNPDWAGPRGKADDRKTANN
jgi:esterase/lipase superfamily enzyme